MNTAATPPELSLPDLPEVPVVIGSAGAGAPRPYRRGKLRWREWLGNYLPLLLMLMLALLTWWLVKNTPREATPAGKTEPYQGVDYQMRNFAITRFSADGAVKLLIEGDELRHHADTDRIEIDTVRIHALGPQGRDTRATARRALVNGDASEVQLQGGAQVRLETPGGEPLEIASEFLHAFLRVERVHSDQTVLLRHGGKEVRAGGIDYDHLSRKLDLRGPVKVQFARQATDPTGALGHPAQ